MQIQAQEQANTHGKPGNQQLVSNGNKAESWEESKNSIHVRVNNEIQVSHRKKSLKRIHARSEQSDSKALQEADQEEISRLNRELEKTCVTQLMT